MHTWLATGFMEKISVQTAVMDQEPAIVCIKQPLVTTVVIVRTVAVASQILRLCRITLAMTGLGSLVAVIALDLLSPLWNLRMSRPTSLLMNQAMNRPNSLPFTYIPAPSLAILLLAAHLPTLVLHLLAPWVPTHAMGKVLATA